MLKIKTNKNNCALTYQIFPNVVISETGGTEMLIEAENHCLHSNDTVAFIRNDGETIYFYEELGVNTVIDKDKFTINKFNDYLLQPISYEVISLRNPLYQTPLYQEYIRLTFTDEHIYTTNKDNIKISGRYYSTTGVSEYSYTGKIELCDDDYVLYDDIFLKKHGQQIILNISELTLTATTIDETYVFSDCLIGVNPYGNDDRFSIYIPNSSLGDYDFDEMFNSTVFTGQDVRFLFDGDNEMVFGTNIKDGVTINKIRGDIEVDFSIGENFEVNLLHDWQIDKYIEEKEEKSINSIIDYERRQFTPVYYSGTVVTSSTQTADQFFENNASELDENLKPVENINFFLNFRQRVSAITEEDEVDYGTWKIDDRGYWNSYTGSTMSPIHSNFKGDLLGCLGFKDSDVRYQKDCLKNSFLRLSFYDSPNRETQKLLYYSTIYFNTNILTKKYTRDMAAWYDDPTFKTDYNELVFYSGDTNNAYNLNCELSCTDMYDDTSSSDGFYLYLFDKIVSGNTVTPLYIKPEFNNAKYGITIPFIYPVNKITNEPIPAVSGFPISYEDNTTATTVGNETGITLSIDVQRLIRDMYIKIYVKYNYITKSFIWFVPISTDSPDMEFELFEPRINEYNK